MWKRFKFIAPALVLLLGCGYFQTCMAKGGGHSGGGHGGGAMHNPVGHGNVSPSRLLRGRGRGGGRGNGANQEDQTEAEKAAYFDKRSHETPYPAAPRH